MFAFARLMLMALAALTVIFVCLWFYFRAAKREELEIRWRETAPPLPLETYVADRMSQYEAPLKRRLIWGVYVIPSVLIALLIYLTTNA
jgi:hypothetical protein